MRIRSRWVSGLIGSGMLLFSGWIPAAADPVYLVELADFACPHCFHMHAYDPLIASAVQATGGVFDFAPVRSSKQSDAAAKVYFASRAQGPEIAAETETLLFEAMASDGIPVQNVTQGVVFLQQDWPKTAPVPNYDALALDTASGHVETAVKKAMDLAEALGVSKLPAFVFVHNGRPVSILERSTRFPNMLALKRAVLNAIALYSQGAKLRDGPVVHKFASPATSAERTSEQP